MTRSLSPVRPLRADDACVVALAALVLAPYVWTSAVSADEFTNLSHGVRQLQGQVLYRDFFELVAPLSMWLPAGIFALTGPSLLAARAVQGAWLVLAAWQSFRLARALDADRVAALLVGPTLILGLYRFLPGYSHHWLALPFVLGAVQAALRAHATERRRWWALSGAATGLCLLTLQSDGAALVAALGAWLLADAWLGRRPVGLLLRRVTALAAGFVVPLLAAGLYFVSQGALGAALYHIVVWPLNHYKPSGGANDIKFLTDIAVIATTSVGWVNLPYWYARTLHYLAILALLPAVTLVVLAWGLGRVQLRLRGRTWQPAEARLALVGALACACFAVAVRGRADSIHIAAYGLPALITAGALATRWARRFPGSALAGLPHVALLLFCLSGALQLVQAMRAQPDVWLSPRSPDARLAASPALAYLRSHARPGDRVVAFPFGGMFYMYGLPPASRFSVILPPSEAYNTPEEFAEFWREVQAARPRFLVFAPYRALADTRDVYMPVLPAGYRLAATLPSPVYPGEWVEIYEGRRP